MNIFMRRVIILFAMAIMVYASNAFTQTISDYKSPPPSEGDNIWSSRRYYVGMSKDELYKVYPPQSRQNYFKQGDEEWIVFDDMMTETDLEDIIAFYLKNGKVAGWDKKTLPISPEERLKAIIARHGHSIGQSSGGGTGNGSEQKRQARIRDMESQRANEIPVYSENKWGRSGRIR